MAEDEARADHPLAPPLDALERRFFATRVRIREAFGVEPDLTHDTLPLLDAYLKQIAQDLPPAERDRALEEIACHFGEVVRRSLLGRWVFSEDLPPEAWRIEFTSCFLYFHPFGMTAEVLVGCESEDHDGSFATNDDLHEPLTAMLDSATPMSEEAYYSLSGRYDILVLATDFLTGRRVVDAKGKPPPPIPPEDYARAIASRQPS